MAAPLVEFCALALPVSAAATTLMVTAIPAICLVMEASLFAWPGCARAALPRLICCCASAAGIRRGFALSRREASTGRSPRLPRGTWVDAHFAQIVTATRLIPPPPDTTYPATIQPIAREQRMNAPPNIDARARSAAEVADWLTNGTRDARFIDDIFAEMCIRLRQAGIPVKRASLHIVINHPQWLGA